MSTMRAMRRLAPEPVPDELVRGVIEAATWAPSGGNWQPARFLVVTDRETIGRLAIVWRRVIGDWRTLLEAAGIDPSPTASARRTNEAIDYEAAHFEEVPALIVVCSDTRALAARSPAATLRALVARTGPRRAFALAAAWRRASTRSEGASYYPAVQNLLLAARARGLGACLTTWHLFAEDEFKSILGIPQDVKTWAVIPMGWPLRPFGPVNRRPVDDVIRRERW